jgi:hypothetical protein
VVWDAAIVIGHAKVRHDKKDCTGIPR